MHIVFLKFGPNRSQAAQWMAAHNQWIQSGIDDGVFLMAGSLESAQGGAILAAKTTKEELASRVQQDPFVAHGVVVPEIISVTPSRTVEGFARLID
ncbi:YciI family protein [Acidovorax sp.]|uniref:YciI family protein n=1 Tax=Acidovorax sp. TaxID=1872122 RepID=UPI0026261D9E|nr:YciI family protein [Acidovorax sp.]